MAGKGGIRSTSWKKGENPKRKEGQKSKTTLLKESMGLSNWDRLASFIKNEGAEKLVDELSTLKGRDFINAYSGLAEYVKPKLQRTTIEGDPDKPLVTSNLDNLSFQELYQLKYDKKPE
jgi:hypothetical protein